MSLTIRSISFLELENRLPSFVDLLSRTVNGGASLGFLAPLQQQECREYWLSLRRELRAGTRLLLAASADGELVGSGQLTLSSFPNSRHRAELQKLFVSPTLRGQGVGRALMGALHEAARKRGRSLVLLNSRPGGVPERFYKALGYREVGKIPGYTLGPAGERYDSLTLYCELTTASAPPQEVPAVRSA